jgi:ribonuclease HI
VPQQQVVLADRTLSVFTDGSGQSRPRRGGIGIRFVHTDGVGNETPFDLVVPGYAGETVNRMELQAIIVALRTIEKGRLPTNLLAEIRRIDVYTDSMYVAENLRNALYTWPRSQWTTREGAPVLNADLWKQLVRAYRRVQDLLRLRVEIMWRKGHSSSNPHNKVADKLAKQSAAKPQQNATRVAPVVRRKKSTRMTERGSVLMLGQKLTIHIIEAEYLREQRINRYRYEVMSRKSQFRGRVDVAFSDDPMLRPGHTYFVSMGADQGNPRIIKCYREIGAKTSPEANAP